MANTFGQKKRGINMKQYKYVNEKYRQAYKKAEKKAAELEKKRRVNEDNR